MYDPDIRGAEVRGRVLPFALDVEPYALLVDAWGHPVWPLTDNRELPRLYEAAAVLGVAPQLATTVRYGHNLYRRRGAVIAVGQRFADAAKLYGHLTGRSWRVVRTAADVVPASAALILLDLADLHSDMLQRIYTSQHIHAVPGFLAAADATAMRELVLMRSATVLPAKPSGIAGAFLSPTSSFGQTIVDGMLMLSGDAEPQLVRQALTAGVDVLAVVTHSDGIDAYLGPDLVLCPAPSWMADKENGTTRCQKTGTCHRLQARLRDPKQHSVAAAIGSEFILSAGKIATRTLIWDSCWGILQRGGAVAPEDGQARPWLSSAKIGMLVTSWQQVDLNPSATLRLAQAIQSGVSVGKAVLEHNLASATRQSPSLLMLFGDPDQRCFADTVAQLDRRLPECEPAPRTVRQAAPGGPGSALSFLSAMCATEVGHSSRRARARAAIARRVDYPSPETCHAARVAVLGMAASMGTDMYKLWSHLATERTLHRGEVDCDACGRKVDRVRFSFETPGWSDRLLDRCPRCAIVRDSIDLDDLHLRLRRRNIALSSTRSGSIAAAMLVISGPVPADRVEAVWPMDADGVLRASMDLPASLPPGWIDISLHYMINDTLGMVARRVSGGRTGNGDELTRN